MRHSAQRAHARGTAASALPPLLPLRGPRTPRTAADRRLGAGIAAAAPHRLQRSPARPRDVHATAAAPAAPAAAAVVLPAVPLSFEGRPGTRNEEGKVVVKSLTLEELTEWCESIGESPKRAAQLWRWCYKEGRFARSWADAAGGDEPLSRAFIAKASAAATLDGGLTLQSVRTAPDGTHKLVFATNAGAGGSGAAAAGGSVETVLIPMYNKDGTQPRYTACVSTQVGCAMNCQFCFTGKMGLLGNLSTAQVVEQIIEARRWLWERQRAAAASGATLDGFSLGNLSSNGDSSSASSVGSLDSESDVSSSSGSSSGGSSSSSPKRGRKGASANRPPAPPRINNIVFMGMGEPLHNMDAVMPALDVMCSPSGLALSKAKVIVSTVGLVPQLRELRASGKAKVAVSLHATTDAVRDEIAPINRRHDLSELMGALAEMWPKSLAKTPGRGDDFIILEYVMLEGVNDTDEDARRLLELTEPIYCMVNLIIFNEHEGTRFKGSSDERVRAFKKVLTEGGRVCTVRASKGSKESAACGQLGEGPGAKKRFFGEQAAAAATGEGGVAVEGAAAV